jgi:hypothetical protein
MTADLHKLPVTFVNAGEGRVMVARTDGGPPLFLGPGQAHRTADPVEIAALRSVSTIEEVEGE